MIRATGKCLTLLAALLVLAACGGFPVRGTVSGRLVETRVDSEAARYYLANYLAGKRSKPELDERIDRIYENARDGLPDRSELKRLSDEFSLDFAALYLADRIDRAPRNRRFREAFDRAYENTRKALLENRVALPAAAAKYQIVFVPGYLYKRVPGTGADFAAPRAALQRAGFAQHFIETDEDGPIEANANLVVHALRALARSGCRSIVVSVSKSGPEVALALTKMGVEDSRHIAAWVNIAGALQGTPLVDGRMLPEIEHASGKLNASGVESLTTERSRQRFDSFRIPEHVLVVNYIGIPLTATISRLGRLGFASLKDYGPNDGITLLSDAIFPQHVTLTDVGRDHFLLNGDIDITAIALATVIIRWLEEPTSGGARIEAQR